MFIWGFPKIGEPNIVPNDPYYKGPKIRCPNFRKVPYVPIGELRFYLRNRNRPGASTDRAEAEAMPDSAIAQATDAKLFGL